MRENAKDEGAYVMVVKMALNKMRRSTLFLHQVHNGFYDKCKSGIVVFFGLCLLGVIL